MQSKMKLRLPSILFPGSLSRSILGCLCGNYLLPCYGQDCHLLTHPVSSLTKWYLRHMFPSAMWGKLYWLWPSSQILWFYSFLCYWAENQKKKNFSLETIQYLNTKTPWGSNCLLYTSMSSSAEYLILLSLSLEWWDPPLLRQSSFYHLYLPYLKKSSVEMRF